MEFAVAHELHENIVISSGDVIYLAFAVWEKKKKIRYDGIFDVPHVDGGETDRLVVGGICHFSLQPI